jgi:hypothetical protein
MVRLTAQANKRTIHMSPCVTTVVSVAVKRILHAVRISPGSI